MKYPPYHPPYNNPSVYIERTRTTSKFVIFDEVIENKSSNDDVKPNHVSAINFYHGRIRAEKFRGMWIGDYHTVDPVNSETREKIKRMYDIFMRPPVGSHRIFKRRFRMCNTYSVKNRSVHRMEQWASIGPSLHIANDKIIRATFHLKNKPDALDALEIRKGLYNERGFWANSMIEYMAQESYESGNLKIMRAL